MLKNTKHPISFLVVVLSIATSSLGWIGLYHWLDSPAPQESLHFFLSTNQYSSTFESELEEKLFSENIQSVSVTALAPENTYYASTLATIGIQECDILVLPKSILESLENFSDFAPLEAPTLASLGLTASEYEFFENSEIPVGLKVFDESNNKNILESWLGLAGEDYFIVVNVNTVNAGAFSVKTGTLTDHSFVALAYLLTHDTN